MEILNLKINDNLDDWGIKRTAKQKILVLNNESIEYDVYMIPIDILVYNPNNGRMFMEARRFENEENTKLEILKDKDSKKYNDEVENLIWSTNEERNLSTKRDIEKYGQIEPGVVLDDGTVIDGNRRFTCLRRLHREHPNNPAYSYFLAAIVRIDGKKITKKLLKEYELRVQFGADEKVGYNVINKNMSIYELIEKSDDNDFDYNTVAELLGNGTTPGDVLKICKTCKLVDEFLEYIGKPGEYQIAEDMKIYWPLEPLVSYISSEGKNLTTLEIEQRKHLFFDYLLTLDVSLITQNLRDGLIKKVFKDKEATKTLIEEHKETIGNKIQDIINESQDVESFNDMIKELKYSDEAAEDKEAYEKAISVQISKNQLDVPIKECKNALKSLENVNVKPLVEASNAIAEKKLQDILSVLDQIVKRIDNIKLEIKSKDEL
ncbi:MAG TPA: hypothetical protein GXZ35_03155 [Acholeplasmataceae bacterium]|nr:hypothetical protein [Acholeplasmataceae bacterium]